MESSHVEEGGVGFISLANQSIKSILFFLYFRQLVELYSKYSETDGLRILGFPCNQFGGQEPGTEQEIKV